MLPFGSFNAFCTCMKLFAEPAPGLIETDDPCWTSPLLLPMMPHTVLTDCASTLSCCTRVFVSVMMPTLASAIRKSAASTHPLPFHRIILLWLAVLIHRSFTFNV